VKVLDFGISKTNPFGDSEHDMTRTASMLGSPRFMSPEQMRDPRQVDGRSDIWSLGVVIYRLVSGRPPFEADTLGRLLTMVMHEKEPPLASIRRDLPPGFAEVVDRCLEKDPDDRFANVAELAYALVPFCDDPARARSAAERIAAVLSVPHPQASDLSMPGSHRGLGPSSANSGASGSGDGTASPWSGTHSGARAPRGATIWLGVALGACLVGFVAKLQLDNQSRAAGRRAETTAVAYAPAPVPVPTVLNPLPTMNVAGLPPAAEPTPAIIGASPLPPTPPPMAMPDPPSLPSRSKGAVPSRPRAAAARGGPGPRPEGGIPATRD
jgi:serine/threonine-protein kinase